MQDGLDFDNEVLITMLLKKNNAQLRATLQEYKIITKLNAWDDVKSSTRKEAEAVVLKTIGQYINEDAPSCTHSTYNFTAVSLNS